MTRCWRMNMRAHGLLVVLIGLCCGLPNIVHASSKPKIPRPQFTGSDPAEGAVGVSPNLGQIVIQFDQPMATGGTFKLIDHTRRSKHTLKLGAFASGNAVIAGLPAALVANGSYEVRLSGARSAAGKKMSGTKKIHFTTASSAGPTPTPTPDPNGGGGGSGDGSSADLGNGASLHGARPFPNDNAWNQDISASPVDSNSANLIASIGLTRGLHPDFGTVWDGAPIGIPYSVVSGGQAGVSVTFDYDDESDHAPYPIPANVQIEGGAASTGDRHVLLIDRDNWKLYELFAAYPQPNGSWHAGSGAIFDLKSNALRPSHWTSADAAGLPIFPGLVRYDEVMEQGEIRHALRFTVQRSRKAFVAPATHYASSNTDPNLPPMGMRVRLKASFDISGFPAPVQVILRAMKKYGMFVADNGSNWFVSGAPDARWNDDVLSNLRFVQGQDFEVVQMGPLTTN